MSETLSHQYDQFPLDGWLGLRGGGAEGSISHTDLSVKGDETTRLHGPKIVSKHPQRPQQHSLCSFPPFADSISVLHDLSASICPNSSLKSSPFDILNRFNYIH